jgi:hypothetical protein
MDQEASGQDQEIDGLEQETGPSSTVSHPNFCKHV